MKKTLIILLLFTSLSLQATTYYVATAANGGNDANTGLIGFPVLHLHVACEKALVAGDVINIGIGTFTETDQSSLARGVSIEGEGVTSIIHSHFVSGYNFTIELYDASLFSGNQHISNIKMDGDNYTAYGAIYVQNRSNVEIYNCEFVNFSHDGCYFLASAYVTGNKFYGNTVTNCSGYDAGNHHALHLEKQDGTLVYNNTMTTNRTAGSNGILIWLNTVRNIKIHDNTLTKRQRVAGGDPWDFAIESWDVRGGCEIYNNTLKGAIDFGGYSNIKEVGTYSAWVHDNTIGYDTLDTFNVNAGVYIEGTTENSDIIIEKNYFKNTAKGIDFGGVGTGNIFNNIRISYNVFDNIGVNAYGVANSGWGIWQNPSSDTFVYDSIFILNNTFIGHEGGSYTGIMLPSSNFCTNIKVVNNIVENFTFTAVRGFQAHNASEHIHYLAINNNVFYNNGNSNVPSYEAGFTYTNETLIPNYTSDPVFSLTDYHLQTTSPAKDAGVSVGLTRDYDGVMISGLPDIGAYEFITTDVTERQIMNGNNLIMNGNNRIVYTYVIPAPPSTLLTGLVLALKLDETSGVSVDETGTQNLTNNNITQGQPGKISNANRFTGTSYTTGINTTYEFTTDFAVSFWIKTSASGSTQRIISNLYDAGVGDYYGWSCAMNSTGKLIFNVYNNSVSPTSTSSVSTTNIGQNVWINVICTFSSVDGTHIYINNSEEDNSSWVHSPAYHASNRFEIGVADGDGYFTGLLDEVRVWNRVLSGPGERTELYTKENAGTSYPWN